MTYFCVGMGILCAAHILSWLALELLKCYVWNIQFWDFIGLSLESVVFRIQCLFVDQFGSFGRFKGESSCGGVLVQQMFGAFGKSVNTCYSKTKSFSCFRIGLFTWLAFAVQINHICGFPFLYMFLFFFCTLCCPCPLTLPPKKKNKKSTQVHLACFSFNCRTVSSNVCL